MQVMSGHKGKVNAAAFIKGKEAHSALTTKGLNSIYMASELIQGIQNIQTYLINNSEHDHDFEVPYTTLQVGKIEGGVATNIVPSSSTLLFEIRNIAMFLISKSKVEELGTIFVATPPSILPTCRVV